MEVCHRQAYSSIQREQKEDFDGVPPASNFAVPRGQYVRTRFRVLGYK